MPSGTLLRSTCRSVLSGEGRGLRIIRGGAPRCRPSLPASQGVDTIDGVKRIAIIVLIGIVAGAIAAAILVARPAPLPPPVRPDGLAGIDPLVLAAIAKQADASAAAPSSAVERARLAMIYDANMLYGSALTSYEQAMLGDASQPRWWYYLAMMRSKSSDLASALAALDQAEALEPSYAPIHRTRGFWLLDLGDLEAASQAFDRTLAIESGDAGARAGHARIALMQNRADDAIALLESLANEHPQAGYFRQLLGKAYQQAGRLADAGAVLAGVGSTPPDWPDAWRAELDTYRTGYRAMFERSDRLAAAGRFPESLTALESLREAHGTDPVLLAKIGELHLLAGNTNRAEAELQSAIRIDPSYYYAHLHLANLYRERGDANRSLDHVNAILAVHPGFAPAYEAQANVFIDAQDWARAKEALENAVRVGTPSMELRLNIARIAYQLGDHAAVVQYAGEVQGQRPGDLTALILLSRGHIGLGQLDQAEGWLRQASQRSPSNADVQQTATELQLARQGSQQR